MPEPSTGPYEWASNPNHAAGPNPWNGQPTKVTPSAGQIQAGFVPNTPFPSEIANKLFNNIGEWLNWLKTLPADLTAVAARVTALEAFQLGTRIVSDWWTYPTAKSTTIWIPTSAYQHRGAGTMVTPVGDDDYVETYSGAVAGLNLTPYLTNRMRVIGVGAVVVPRVAEPTSSERMRLVVKHHDAPLDPFDNGQTLVDVRCDNVNTAHVMGQATMPQLFIPDRSGGTYSALIYHSDNAVSNVTSDTIGAFFLDVEYVGPDL